MEFKFGKGPANDAGGEHEEQGQQDKGRQTTLLVLLLLLLGVVGYLYFFTDLIRPQEAPPKPAPPPQVVKQPLPPKADGEASPPATVVDTAKAGQPAASVPAAKPAPAAPAAPVKQPAATAPAQPVKPAPVTVAPSAPLKPAATAAPSKPEPQKPVTAPVKPATQVTVKKEIVPKPAAAKPKPASKESGPWTLVVGSYVMEGALAEDMAKIRKAGLTPLITTGPKQPMAMHRLFYGAYDDKAEAQKAVEMLKRQTGSGFLIQKGAKYEVYAGSYSLASGAESEQKRLASAGIKVTMQKTAVPVPSKKLTAGTFTDRKAAEAALKKVKAVSAGTPVLD